MTDDAEDIEYTPDEISAMYRESFKIAMSQHETERERDIRNGKEPLDPFIDLVFQHGVLIPNDLKK